MLKDFENYVRYERQLATSTIQRYLFTLNEFQRFLQSDMFNKKLNDITKENISEFVIHLTNKGMSKASIANYISTLRTFYKWAAYITKKENLLTVNFFLANIIKIKREFPIPYIPSREDIKSLRKTLYTYLELLSFDKTSPAYKKTVMACAIIELLITSGIRSGELRNLRYQDIDLENKTLFIKSGKGGYQRISLFGETAYKTLIEYFAINNFKPEDLLFPYKQPNVINYTIRRWAKRAQIKNRMHAHAFRHYFITESQKQGVRAEVVADQVGHKSINSTKYYTHFNIDFLREKYHDINI